MATKLYATAGSDDFIGGVDETTVSYEKATGAVHVFLSGGGSPSGWALGDTYVDIGTVVGSDYGDYVSGNGQNNHLYGGGGDDSIYGFGKAGSTSYLYGGAGIDGLIGGAGIDVMDGGAGADVVSYLLSPAGLTISLADPSINTGWAQGDEYLSIQDVIGSRFGDVIHGSKEGLLNQLQGQEGNDQIYGGTGYNVLIGGSGADRLSGAGTGNLVDYETAKSGLTASLANSSINTGDAAGDTYVKLRGADLAGSPFDDVLYGDDGNNNILGDPNLGVYKRFGNDKLYGGGGNDILQSDGGADRLDGGSGYDVVSYAASKTGITVSMTNPKLGTGDAAGDTFFGVEGILGSKFADTITGTGKIDVIQGGAGNDTIYGAGGNDLVLGNDGNDTLYASGTSELRGGAGADTFRFLSVRDSVSTNKIAPTLITDFQHGVDKIDVSALSPTKIAIVQESGFYALKATTADGTLTVRSTKALTLSDVVATQPGKTLKGDAGDNQLLGGQGNDILNGGAGKDRMAGEKGNDVFVVDNVGDTVVEKAGGGTDTVRAGVSFTLGANVENLALTGISATNGTGNGLANTLAGNGGANTLKGLGGNDVLSGGAGADRLVGGAGTDKLTGGAGNDAFVFNAFLSAKTNVDSITDFRNVAGNNDVIHLDNAVFAALAKTGALAAGAFVANADGVATDGNDRIVYETDTGKLFYDANGSAAGGSVHFATLAAHPALTAADFLVV